MLHSCSHDGKKLSLFFILTQTRLLLEMLGTECAQQFFLSNIKWFQDASECVDLFLFSGFQALTTSPTFTVTLSSFPPFYNTQWALLYRGRGKITMTPVIPAATVLQAQNRAADNQKKRKNQSLVPELYKSILFLSNTSLFAIADHLFPKHSSQKQLL